ncbi:uncharacterized protein N7459_008208 [Penicillium hispanicum]|uniref:uncharacterized protein n=1 Tax=Penicillium hispanicum TaxID=1080232 RepID=UPI0025412001|nr:uncharacterized protein N7459_008208 [Penicillium hispanicum]KAJ5573781.1 hypothetical protein N7459_008208 [Penicillium hispanicum]
MEEVKSNAPKYPPDRDDQSAGEEKVQDPKTQLHLKPPAPSVSASGTPSSVGDVEAAVPVAIPETTAPLSLRLETDSMSHSHTAVHHAHSESLLQQSHLNHDVQASIQTIQPSALTVGDIEDASPGSIRLGPAEFAVTLPMDSRVKDDYERVLTDAATSMREFLASFNPNSRISSPEKENLLSQMQNVTARLNNVSTHPDLNISHYLTETESDLTKEAAWAEYSSAKFLFLGHLIEIASQRHLHLILAVEDAKKQEVMERYLRGKGFNYTRPREELGGSLEVSLAKGSLSFGVHSKDSVRDLFRTPSAIFVLDAAFNPKSPSVQHIRTTYTRNGSLLPIVWFLVSNTCEHIERCLPDLPEHERLRLLLQYTARLHNEVGDLQDDSLGVSEDAEEITNYLLDGVMAWPLPTVEPLPFVSIEELESSTPSSDESQPATQKRPLPEEDDGDFASKRARVDFQDTSQLTDSTKPPSQTLDYDLHSLERNLLHMKTSHAAEKEQLQKDLVQARSRSQEMEKALSELQHRYESRTNELHKTRQERDSVVESKTSLEQRVEKSKEDISKLKEERSRLQQELEEAREELKAGGGSLADLETAREEIRRLNKEHASFERKAEYEKNQAEYTREQYQTASTVAAQAGNEARQLREENENLKRKVEGNAVRLRELTMQSDSARHLSRIRELELTLASREELLHRKDEELREIRKNRPSTRSTSTQPRSPKWAAGSRPTSPGINNGNGNGNNGGLAGRGSALRFSSEVPF